MKKITLRADGDLIARARSVARIRRTTLNAAFREWLEQFTANPEAVQAYDALMKRLGHVNAGKKFTRDEMSERAGPGPEPKPTLQE